MLQLVIGVEKNRERVRRVGQATMRERVGREQVAELIMDGRDRNGQNGQQCKARRDGEQSQRDKGERFLLRKGGTRFFNGPKPTVTGQRGNPGSQQHQPQRRNKQEVHHAPPRLFGKLHGIADLLPAERKQSAEDRSAGNTTIPRIP